jgi:hypothetical protein
MDICSQRSTEVDADGPTYDLTNQNARMDIIITSTMVSDPNLELMNILSNRE